MGVWNFSRAFFGILCSWASGNADLYPQFHFSISINLQYIVYFRVSGQHSCSDVSDMGFHGGSRIWLRRSRRFENTLGCGFNNHSIICFKLRDKKRHSPSARQVREEITVWEKHVLRFASGILTSRSDVRKWLLSNSERYADTQREKWARSWIQKCFYRTMSTSRPPDRWMCECVVRYTSLFLSYWLDIRISAASWNVKTCSFNCL